MNEIDGEIRLQYLLGDASYLKDELEALKSVIESVPYREKPLDGYSILEMIALIDHHQQNVYRPLFGQAADRKPVSRRDIEEDFTFRQEEVTSIDEFLNSVIRHRTTLLKTLHAIDEDKWPEIIDEDGRTLLDLLQSMIDNERNQLRGMAEHVVVMNSGKLPSKNMF